VKDFRAFVDKLIGLITIECNCNDAPNITGGVIEIGDDYLVLASEKDEEKEICIPFHSILFITDANNKNFKKRERRKGGASIV
jgi:hypothetical protein